MIFNAELNSGKIKGEFVGTLLNLSLANNITNYFEHGEAPISNIIIENQIRPFALSRRTWLFTGSLESANKAAIL
jgi:hypothetical protein